MAKKKSSGSNNNNSRNLDLTWLSKFLAFFALVLAIAVFTTVTIANAVDQSAVFPPYIMLIKDLCLIGAILLPAYWFTKGKHKAWKIIYWVCFAIVIIGAVLGNGNFFK